MAADRLSAEEIVVKHLESIGSPEARQTIKSIVTAGVCTVTKRGGGQMSGRAVLASEGAKHLIGMTFASTDYPVEKIGYDGEELTVGYVRPGVLTQFGTFMVANGSIFKQGLVGGTLSTSWALLHLDDNKPKLDYAGTKKINDREVYQIKYLPRKGSDMRVSLYFDAETFRHVRSEYERTISAGQGASVNSSANQRESRFQFVEDFGDFKKIGKLTLPTTYRMHMSVEVQSGTVVYDWVLNLTQFRANAPIDAGSFNVNAQ